MSKKPKKEVKYYSVENIDKCDADINVIFGKRSNGKSYALKKKILENYFNGKGEGGIVRRYQEDWKQNVGKTYWEDMIDVIVELSEGNFNSVKYQGNRWYLAKVDFDGNTEIFEVPFCYAFTISDSVRYKSSQYPRITTVVLEEFIDGDYAYLANEVFEFMNIISTIDRGDHRVKVYLLGNTVNKDNPYFREFGFRDAYKLLDGEIKLTEFPSGLRIAYEHTESNTGKTEGDLYYSFSGSPQYKMITLGDWAIDLYPHMTTEYKYKPKDIVYSFYVDYNDELLKGDIITKDDLLYIYIYPKTTELLYKDTDIVYTDKFSIKPNVINNIFTSDLKISNVIVNLLTKNNILYKDNDCGDLMNRYLESIN